MVIKAQSVLMLGRRWAGESDLEAGGSGVRRSLWLRGLLVDGRVSKKAWVAEKPL